MDVEHLSETLHEEVCAVSSLFTGGRCSVVVPDCSQWGSPITLRIYANDSQSSAEPLYASAGLTPGKTSDHLIK